MPMSLQELARNMAVKRHVQNITDVKNSIAGITGGDLVEAVAQKITAPLYEDGGMTHFPGEEPPLTGQAKSMREDSDKEAILTRAFGPRESWSPEVAEKLSTYFNPPEKYKDPNYIRDTAIQTALMAAGGIGGLGAAKPLIKDAVRRSIVHEPAVNMIKLFGKKGLGTKGGPATEKAMPLKEVFKFQRGSRGGKGIKSPERVAEKMAEEARQAKEKSDNFWKMGGIK